MLDCAYFFLNLCKYVPFSNIFMKVDQNDLKSKIEENYLQIRCMVAHKVLKLVVSEAFFCRLKSWGFAIQKVCAPKQSCIEALSDILPYYYLY